MAPDASSVLGAPQLAGTFVSPKGLTRRMTGVAAAGAFGGVAAGMAAQASATFHPYEGAPEFGAIGYVASPRTRSRLSRASTA